MSLMLVVELGLHMNFIGVSYAVKCVIVTWTRDSSSKHTLLSSRKIFNF